MASGAIRNLAEDALFERRMKREGHLVENLAGIELIRGADSSLPTIEALLTETVVAAHDSRDFPGLAYVLGAYLVIGVRADPQRTFSFLRELPPRLLARAVSVVSTFFSGRTQPQAARSAVTIALLEFLEHESGSDHIAVRYRAAQALQQINEKRTEDAYSVFDMVRDQPRMYISKKTIESLENYYNGYTAAWSLNRIPVDDGTPPFDHFGDWLERRFGKAFFDSRGRVHRSVKSSFTVISEEYENTEEAFENFFVLMDEYRRLQPRLIGTASLSAEDRVRLSYHIPDCEQFEATRYVPDEGACLTCICKSYSMYLGYFRTLKDVLNYTQVTYGIGSDAWVIDDSSATQ